MRSFLMLAAAAALLSSSLTAHATSLVLSSSSDGTYNYDLSISPGGDIFSKGETFITLTGLSGVTGATLPVQYADGYLFTLSFTSSSVTLTNAFGGSVSVGDINDTTVGSIFSVTSSVLTEGDAAYVINGDNPASGTVLGPVTPLAVAATPEPASIALLFTGMLGVAGAARRRFAEK